MLNVKPTSDQLPCLLAQGDRRRRVNLQHAALEHAEQTATGAPEAGTTVHGMDDSAADSSPDGVVDRDAD